MLENYVGAGDIELQIYPLTFLDASSLGTKYSTRAGNLLGCVVEQQPEYAFAVHNLLLDPSVQPDQNTQGLSDEELIEVAETAGATADTELTQCVNTTQFGAFFQGNTKAATETGIVGLADGSLLSADQAGQTMQAEGPQRLTSTPLVIVNGKEWVQARDGGLENFILKEMDSYNQEADEADAEAEAESEEDTE